MFSPEQSLMDMSPEIPCSPRNFNNTHNKSNTNPIKLIKNSPNHLTKNTLESSIYTPSFKAHISKNRHVLNRSKTESEFYLSSSRSIDTNINPSSSLTKLKQSYTDLSAHYLLKNTTARIQPKIRSNSSISLEPLSSIFSDTLTDSLKKLNSANPSKSTKEARRSRSQKKLSSQLSINDYSNIINMNTSHQMLVDYLETSRKIDNLPGKKNRGHKSLTVPKAPEADLPNPQFNMYLTNYIQKQATLSEQMASLFGSSMCACNLCRMKTIDSKRILQHNYEITPDKFNLLGYTIQKYTYSSPISELSTLKLFNLMNTDCSIFFNETKPASQANINFRLSISNNNVLLPFGSTENLPINNSIKVNNNSPPMYDSRYMYLIDCRLNKEAFEKSRILTAIHYTDLLNDNVYLSPPFENYTSIVLYDEDGQFLTTSFDKVKNPKSLEPDPLLNESDFIIDAIRTKLNCSQSKTVYILSGGYKEFSTKFPFMTSHLNIRSTVDRNKYLTFYPNCVIENQIYIGSAIQAKNWKIIRELNITHIINASFEHECVFKDEIKYLHVEVEDSHDEKIHKTFKTALEFMKNAFEEYQESLMKESSDYSFESCSLNNMSEPRVLKPPVLFIHCNLGISRSSSILIAYLICKYRLCLYAAFKYVKDKRLQIAPNYSFLRQLKEFEEYLF